MPTGFNFDEFDSKKIKKLIIDLLPIIVCTCIIVSFFTSDWFKDWLGSLPTPEKISFLGGILIIVFYERADRFRKMRN